jgi:hypothetical protein
VRVCEWEKEREGGRGASKKIIKSFFAIAVQNPVLGSHSAFLKVNWRAQPNLRSLDVVTRAQCTRVHFYQQLWLLCHWVCNISSSSSLFLVSVPAGQNSLV